MKKEKWLSVRAWPFNASTRVETVHRRYGMVYRAPSPAVAVPAGTYGIGMDRTWLSARPVQVLLKGTERDGWTGRTNVDVPFLYRRSLPVRMNISRFGVAFVTAGRVSGVVRTTLAWLFGVVDRLPVHGIRNAVHTPPCGCEPLKAT